MTIGTELARKARGALGSVGVLTVALCPRAISAQPAPAAVPDPPEASQSDIVVRATRGSALADIAPVAELDADAIAATGATDMAQLRQAIQGQTQSADGSEPILLLNAQRVSGYQEIGSLPPEALEKVEVLPEQAALRYGYPPTRRVVNFITKRSFSQLEAKAAIGTTLPTGRATESARTGYTRLRGDGRLTANLEYARSDPLLQSEQGIAPDPDIPFDAIGNITAPGGGEIDPALSALAGRAVIIAPVPIDPGDRGLLSAYAAAANSPRLFAPGPYATLAPRNDTLKGQTVLGGPVGETLAGSFTLSLEQTRDRTLGGPAAAALVIPADNPFSPFGNAAVLNRYLVEAAVLRQREMTTTLATGATLRGAIAGWQWDASLALNQVTKRGAGERGIDLSGANAAIAAGADPFGPLDPALLAGRLTDRTRQRTRSIESKLVATGTALTLPAGGLTATATLEAGRSSAASSLEGADPFSLELARTRVEVGLAVDVPVTSRDADAAPFAGDVSVSASGNLRRVEDFGTLRDSTLGVTWTPLKGVQLLATRKRSEAAPDLVQQSTPPREIENVPLFDFGSGRTEIVTLFLGGNPGLLAEQRRVSSLSLNLKPWAKHELRFGASYEDATILDQTGTIYAITPQIEALVPELFGRDAAGRLVSVSYRPINFYREWRRKLQFSFTASGRIGRPPPPAAPGTAPPKDERGSYYAGFVPTVTLEDRPQLRPGTAPLDLLNGDSIGSYAPRVAGYAYGGVNRGGYGATFKAYYGGERRIRGTVPAAVLLFRPILQLGFGAYLPVQALFPKADWTHRLQLRLDTENILDSRQRVTDGNGDVPNRYQTDLIDPLGRTITLSLRKRF